MLNRQGRKPPHERRPQPPERKWIRRAWGALATLVGVAATVYLTYWVTNFPADSEVHPLPGPTDPFATRFEIKNIGWETWRQAIMHCEVIEAVWSDGSRTGDSHGEQRDFSPIDVPRHDTITRNCEGLGGSSAPLQHAEIELVIRYMYRKFPLGPRERVEDRHIFRAERVEDTVVWTKQSGTHGTPRPSAVEAGPMWGRIQAVKTRIAAEETAIARSTPTPSPPSR